MLNQLQAFAQRTLPLPLLVQLQKLHYPRHVRQFSERDEPEVAIVRHLIEPGDCVVDAGAHVGKYTRVLSEAVGPAGTVYALEPIPTTFKLLTHCVRRLRLTNVTPLQVGVSDADHRALMAVPRQVNGYNFYQSSLAFTKNCSASDLQFSVELRALDSVLSQSPRVAFIKCDVEGHDLEAVRGATRIVQRCKPALMLEVSGDPDQSGSRAYHVCATLKDLGYFVCWYDGIQLHPRAKGDHPVNYFFLTGSQLSRLREKGVRLHEDMQAHDR